MNSKEIIRFAVVGQGHIGKRHAEMIRRNAEAELVAVCDIKTKEDLGISDIEVPFFNDIDSMLDSGIDTDVVCICVPNGYHSDYAVKALNHGCHVVVEKPMSLTRRDAEIIIETSEKAKRNVFCVMQNRYSPPSVWLKETIDSGILGKIFMVQLACYWNRDERYYKKGGWHGTSDLDGGTLYTQFSHFVDIMYWLFGDITNIKGHFADCNHQKTTDFEDSGFVSFDFVKGGMGTICYSSALYDCNLESSITIIAENGTIKVSGQYMNDVVYCNIKDYEMPVLAPSNPPNDYGAYKGSAQNHHLVIKNVVDTLKGRSSISTTADEEKMVVDIIERIYKYRDTVWKKQ